ncbi:hypothetical protein JYQ62_25040 [Nostoc sp. UHCC 0702]|nr:hypothetical protein JYQ62_25040 [Nostoc sp. UHCC 0702]
MILLTMLMTASSEQYYKTDSDRIVHLKKQSVDFISQFERTPTKSKIYESASGLFK